MMKANQGAHCSGWGWAASWPPPPRRPPPPPGGGLGRLLPHPLPHPPPLVGGRHHPLRRRRRPVGARRHPHPRPACLVRRFSMMLCNMHPSHLPNGCHTHTRTHTHTHKHTHTLSLCALSALPPPRRFGPAIKMKQLHWEKLPDAVVAKTIWGMHPLDEEYYKRELNFKDFEALFAAKLKVVETGAAGPPTLARTYEHTYARSCNYPHTHARDRACTPTPARATHVLVPGVCARVLTARALWAWAPKRLTRKSRPRKSRIRSRSSTRSVPTTAVRPAPLTHIPTCTFAHTYAHMHTQAHTYARMHTQAHTYAHMHTQAHTYAHRHTCIHRHTYPRVRHPWLTRLGGWVLRSDHVGDAQADVCGGAHGGPGRGRHQGMRTHGHIQEAQTHRGT
jgi:hypothetical protein